LAREDKAFASLLPRIIIETPGEVLLNVLHAGKVSINIYLRHIHNDALCMEWLLKLVILRRQWPRPVFKSKRAITAAEQRAIEGVLPVRTRTKHAALSGHWKLFETIDARIRSHLFKTTAIPQK
jgi:hypothetical protein